MIEVMPLRWSSVPSSKGLDGVVSEAWFDAWPMFSILPRDGKYKLTLSGWSHPLGEFDSLEVAQAAAHTHYEKQIRKSVKEAA